jgi:hypothetical protein
MTVVLLGGAVLAQGTPPNDRSPVVPRPEEIIGFAPGTDRKLADTGQIEAYFRALDAASDRLTLTTFGTSTEGRPLLLAVITSPENQSRIEEIRRNHLALGTEPPETSECAHRSGQGDHLRPCVDPFERTRPRAGVDGTRVESLHERRRGDAVDPRRLRRSSNPVHNPDGYDRVVDWYRRWVGTPYEGAPMVDLYHKYVGHDNNRDWFMGTQKETRATIEGVHRAWRPLVALDQHQMDSDGARMFVPPYQAPVDPAIPDGVVARTRELGKAVFDALALRAREGVVTDTLFDAWSPSRSALPYHGGVRFLTEIASARFASPIDVKRAKGRGGVSYEGPWSLGDIVIYNNDAASAAIGHIARNRRAWLSAYDAELRDARRGVDGRGRAAAHHGFLIKRTPGRLFAGGVPPARSAIGRMSSSKKSPRPTRRHPANERRLRARARRLVHPASATLLRRGVVAAHRTAPTPTSSIATGVGVRPTTSRSIICRRCSGLRASTPAAATRPRGSRASRPSGDAWSRRCRSPSERRPTATPSRADFRRSRRRPRAGASRSIATPTLLWRRAGRDGGSITTESDSAPSPTAISSTDFGRNRGRPTTPTRVLVLPGQTETSLTRGPTSRLLPPAFRSGLGQGPGSAAESVKAWVEAGGHLVTFGASGAWAVKTFELPLRNALVSVEKRISLPGTALRLELGAGRRPHPLPASGHGGARR